MEQQHWGVSGISALGAQDLLMSRLWGGQNHSFVGTGEYLLWVDEMHFAAPKKSYDDSPVNSNKQMVSHGFKVVQECVHPQ